MYKMHKCNTPNIIYANPFVSDLNNWSNGHLWLSKAAGLSAAYSLSNTVGIISILSIMLTTIQMLSNVYFIELFRE